MANKRVFYACEAVAIGPINPENEAQALSLSFVHGVQSVGITTNFNVEAIFELGQSAPYDQIETNPEIEVTLEKVIDGYQFIYRMATHNVNNALINSLDGRLKQRCNVAMAIGNDESTAISGGVGAPNVEMFMSGMYVNSVSYTFPADGNATESVTLVGNNKTWNVAGVAFDNSTTTGLKANAGMRAFNTGLIDDIKQYNGPNTDFNEDFPIGLGGIVRREDVLMNLSVIPDCIFGVTPKVSNPSHPVGYLAGNNWDQLAGRPRAHITNITISMGDAGREDIYELGHKDPYYKSAAGSKEVTAEIEVATVSGDFLGIYSDRDTSPQQPIYLTLTNGATFNLGPNNKVTSVSYGGGEAGGGNLTITYSFTNQNFLEVTSPTGFQPTTSAQQYPR